MGSVDPFQLRFSKEGTDPIVQNRPRSDLDGLVRVWPNVSVLEKQAGVQESSGPVRANASQLIRTGCESGPACLLGDVY